MKRLFTVLIPLSLLALSGCVVAPAHGYYYGPRVMLAAPAPVVVVHGGWVR